jgi:hypothetical protein
LLNVVPEIDVPSFSDRNTFENVEFLIAESRLHPTPPGVGAFPSSRLGPSAVDTESPVAGRGGLQNGAPLRHRTTVS